MKLSEFDYELPAELIAQRPAAQRERARLLAHDLARDETEHLTVRELPRLLRAGDLLVVNDTRVLPARCLGHRASGGEVELLLLEPADGEGAVWRALVHPARKLRPGETIELERGALRARMVRRLAREDGGLEPEWEVELSAGAAGGAVEGDVLALLERHGRVPLPPYIERPRADPARDEDRARYQTVYARRPGAIAAPTAGLHFSRELLDEIERRGVRRAALTLHVGYGTFQPLKGELVEGHRLHAERFELGPSVVEEIARARSAGGRVIAVGTTTVRTLEACALPGGLVEARAGRTELFLRPGSPFRVVDALFTNFHLPRSSLLLLVCAFGGRERVLSLYRAAVERGYRFYSYGDAMLLTGRPREA